jgi:hypothetical protein
MLTIYIKLLSIMARIVNTRLKGKAFRCDVTGKFEVSILPFPSAVLADIYIGYIH